MREKLTFFVILGACGGLLGCDTTTTVAPYDGALRFDLLEPGTQVTEGDKLAWRLEERGLTVTAQRIAKAYPLQPRTLEAVADALVARYRLGEVTGALERSSERPGSVSVISLSGWIANAGEPENRVLRRGTLLESGDHVYLVEVIARRDDASLDEQAELIRTSLRVGAGR